MVRLPPRSTRTDTPFPYTTLFRSLDGSLKGVPGESMFGGLDKKKCGLKPIALSVWEGWIFINLDPEPAMTLEEFLGDMAPYLSGLSYLYADTPVVLEVKVKCNWKVVMDAFAEAYPLHALNRNDRKSTRLNSRH